jgi:hypothetical protein
MGFLSWIQRWRTVRRARQDGIAESECRQEALRAIMLAIVRASHSNCELLVPYFGFVIPELQQVFVMRIAFEFLFFYMHLVIRLAFAAGLGDEQISSLQGFLGPTLAEAAVTGFCRVQGSEAKERMIDSFYSGLNDAEIRYSRSKVLFDGDLLGDSLFASFGQSIAKTAGKPGDTDLVGETVRLISDEFGRMDIARLLGEWASHSAALSASESPR